MTSSTPIPQGRYVPLANGLTLHYHEAGDTDCEVPVVFLHGSGPGASGYSNFKHNYPAFAEQGHRVIVPDLPGYGLSSKPADAEYVLDFFVGALRALLQALDIRRCILVGNSLGGAIAIMYALDFPADVEKLVLMAPGGVEDRSTYFQMEGIQRMVSLFANRELNATTMRELMSLLVADPVHITDALIGERLPICDVQPPSVLSTMRVPNMTERLEDLACPVLAFWGVEDRFNPVSGAHKLLAHCPDARCLLVNRCGHWVMVEHREVFNRDCLAFLAEPRGDVK
ncbi:alpha/beta fold hydrolase [Pseudoduganella sp. UC29_106]|uniref:alpha/beta fold hydrolase n=1 Tax=Pseudoduganella sp. UC29_106 TaxID=3374553 RepID=UPI003756D243